MAKKKTFDNIVEESFKAGYESEPEIITENTKPEEEPSIANAKRELTAEEINSFIEDYNKIGFDKALAMLPAEEQELLLENIQTGEGAIVEQLFGNAERSTYYLTDLHRACVDIVSHQNGTTKNQVVLDALDLYFSKDVIKAAKELVISRTLKKIERALDSNN